MKTLNCNLCQSKIYPYCLNPQEVMWMCKNEECLFPFNEEPETVKEVCTLQPEYSPVSLFKQVHLVQQGKVDQIESEIIQASEMYTVEVQEDIFDQTQRISEFLTHTKQIDENLVHSFSNEYLEYCEKMTNFGNLFFNYDASNDAEHGDTTIEHEPIFMIEKYDLFSPQTITPFQTSPTLI